MAALGKHFAAAAEPRTGSVTLIARGTVLTGELAGSSPVRVEGTVKGTVALTAKLEVAEGATVEAEVSATRVEVSGTVVGNVTASEMVSLERTARVHGDLVCPALQVVAGAHLEGRVVMRRPPEASAAPPGSSPSR